MELSDAFSRMLSLVPASHDADAENSVPRAHAVHVKKQAPSSSPAPWPMLGTFVLKPADTRPRHPRQAMSDDTSMPDADASASPFKQPPRPSHVPKEESESNEVPITQLYPVPAWVQKRISTLVARAQHWEAAATVPSESSSLPEVPESAAASALAALGLSNEAFEWSLTDSSAQARWTGHGFSSLSAPTPAPTPAPAQAPASESVPQKKKKQRLPFRVAQAYAIALLLYTRAHTLLTVAQSLPLPVDHAPAARPAMAVVTPPMLAGSIARVRDRAEALGVADSPWALRPLAAATPVETLTAGLWAEARRREECPAAEPGLLGKSPWSHRPAAASGTAPLDWLESVSFDCTAGTITSDGVAFDGAAALLGDAAGPALAAGASPETVQRVLEFAQRYAARRRKLWPTGPWVAPRLRNPGVAAMTATDRAQEVRERAKWLETVVDTIINVRPGEKDLNVLGWADNSGEEEAPASEVAEVIAVTPWAPRASPFVAPALNMLTGEIVLVHTQASAVAATVHVIASAALALADTVANATAAPREPNDREVQLRFTPEWPAGFVAAPASLQAPLGCFGWDPVAHTGEDAAKEIQADEQRLQTLMRATLLVPVATWDSVYAYQREALRWMWGLHRSPMRGGILGDDMGLGKTVQVSSYVNALFHSEAARRVLIVVPLATIPQWESELRKWAPGVSVSVFGDSKAKRLTAVKHVADDGGVILVTPNSLALSLETLSFMNSEDTVGTTWDYCFIDEAHRFRTRSTNIYKAACNLPSRRRILVTGTPIQNSLDDVWSLFTLACSTKLLGEVEEFNLDYRNPVHQGLLKGATADMREKVKEVSMRLREKLFPFFLRRDKPSVQMASTAVRTADVRMMAWVAAGCTGAFHADSDKYDTITVPSTRGDGKSLEGIRKNEFVLWMPLSPVQRIVYRAALESDTLKAAAEDRSPLAVLTLLKKVCDHPRLLNPEIPFSRLLTAPPAPRGLNPASDDDDDDDEEDYHRRRGFAVDLNATITYMPDDADADADGEGYEKTLAFTDCVLREAITNGVRHEGTPEEASHDAEYVRVLTRLMSIRADGTGVDTGAIGLDLLHRADMARGVASDSLALADPGRRGTLLPARFSPSAKASSAMIVNASAVDLAMESTKIRVLTELLCALKADGHRTLVFSRSTKMLDLLQPLLMALGMRFERIDGGVRSAQERQARVDRFNSAPSIDVCLLTTTAGGVGLNLTGADRSIIVDPAWNPAVDAQAVDRCYRLGQRRNVVAYRLVTCGTVEEVTYRKQLYKAALNNAATKNQRGAASGAPKFTQRELREVFQFRDSLRSQTLELVRERLLHATPRDTDDELEAHVAFLERGNEGFSIHGVSDHDRVFTVTVEETDEVVDNEEERNPRSTKKGGKDSVEGGQGKGKGKRGGGNDGSGANDAAERRGTVVAVDAETEEALDMAGDAVRMVGATVKRAGGEHAGVQQQKALRSAADLVKKASDRATTDATRGALEAISEFFRISGSLGDSRK